MFYIFGGRNLSPIRIPVWIFHQVYINEIFIGYTVRNIL